MGRSIEQRYGDIAVIFHWLIALLIIGLLVIGKLLGSFDENDPVRYLLTQWHKSFGITVLLGFIVGVAIVGLTFSLFIRDNIKQFGALKAIGVTNRKIAGMVVAQAGMVGVIGYGLGILGTVAFVSAFSSNPTFKGFYIPFKIRQLHNHTGCFVISSLIMTNFCFREVAHIAMQNLFVFWINIAM